jgi:hypothetical protein
MAAQRGGLPSPLLFERVVNKQARALCRAAARM